MRVAVVNFSGNTGKSTIGAHLLAPRMNDAPVFSIETINVDEGGDRLKGKQLRTLHDHLQTLDDAIVDVGASNIEEYFHLMSQFQGSYKDFDCFVVPTVKEQKQQNDTVNTIKALGEIGVTPDRIRVVFNRVDPRDLDIFASDFQTVLGFGEQKKKPYRLSREAIVFENEIYTMLKGLQRSIGQLLADDTDYRGQLRVMTDEAGKRHCLNMIAGRRLAASANENLDNVFAALFPERSGKVRHAA